MDPLSWTLNWSQLRPRLQGDGVVGCITMTRHMTKFSASDWLRSEISPTTWWNSSLTHVCITQWITGMLKQFEITAITFHYFTKMWMNFQWYVDDNQMIILRLVPRVCIYFSLCLSVKCLNCSVLCYQTMQFHVLSRNKMKRHVEITFCSFKSATH